MQGENHAHMESTEVSRHASEHQDLLTKVSSQDQDPGLLADATVTNQDSSPTLKSLVIVYYRAKTIRALL